MSVYALYGKLLCALVSISVRCVNIFRIHLCIAPPKMLTKHHSIYSRGEQQYQKHRADSVTYRFYTCSLSIEIHLGHADFLQEIIFSDCMKNSSRHIHEQISTNVQSPGDRKIPSVDFRNYF